MNRRKFLTNFSLGWISSWAGAILATLYNGILGAASASTPKPTSTSTASTPNPMSTGGATSAPTPKASVTPTNKASSGTFVKVGTVKDLDQKGSLEVKGKDASALIVRDPQNSKMLYAVNASCTHKGCLVKWDTKSKSSICPCHASAFKADGSVQRGPASSPLKKYEAKIQGTDVLLKWS